MDVYKSLNISIETVMKNPEIAKIFSAARRKLSLLALRIKAWIFYLFRQMLFNTFCIFV